MSGPSPESRPTAVCLAFREYPTGARLNEPTAAIFPRPSRRNLRRWLATLPAQGGVVRIGNGRDVRYRLPDTASSSANAAAATSARSAARYGTRNLIRTPQASHTPIGYNRLWLDAYQPNQTRYSNVGLDYSDRPGGTATAHAGLQPPTTAPGRPDQPLSNSKSQTPDSEFADNTSSIAAARLDLTADWLNSVQTGRTRTGSRRPTTAQRQRFEATLQGWSQALRGFFWIGKPCSAERSNRSTRPACRRRTGCTRPWCRIPRFQ